MRAIQTPVRGLTRDNRVSWIAALAALMYGALLPIPVEARDNEQTVLTMLGTSGGPQISAERSNPATLVQVGKDAYLIDCGIGTVRRLAEAGVSIDKIRALFITHLHPDHTMGLADLLADRKFVAANNPQLAPLEVYGPPGTIELANAAEEYVKIGFSVFSIQGVGRNRKTPLYAAHDSDVHPFYADQNITVTSHKNTHYKLMDPASRSQHHSLSFRVATPNGTIVFTGDTGADEGLAEFGKGADLLVAEIVNLAQNIRVLEQGTFGIERSFKQQMIDHMAHQHLTGQEVGLLAKDMGVSNVILNHFGPVDVLPNVLAANIADVRIEYDGQVVAAEDLDRFCATTAAKNHRAAITLCNRRIN